MKIAEGKVKTMTVGQLIEALSAFPADFDVLTEGCDCLGDVGSVEETDSKLSVILCRTVSSDEPLIRMTLGPLREKHGADDERGADIGENERKAREWAREFHGAAALAAFERERKAKGEK